jgi:polar amino acid transport system substrate-binding protein
MPLPDWRECTILAYLDEPPFCFPLPGGQATGCDIEVARHVLSALDVQRVDTRIVTFAELMPGVAAHNWTVNTPLFMTEGRCRNVAFSRPVWCLTDGLLVRSIDSTSLTSYEVLARDERAKVGVIAGQIQEQAALTAGVPPARIQRFATQGEAVDALRRGRIDVYPSVAAAHRVYLHQHPALDLVVIDLLSKTPEGKSSTSALGAYSFALENHSLRRAWDQILDLFLGSSRHREIMRRYGFLDAEIDRVL